MDKPPLDANYRSLVAAVILRAVRDLRNPGYRHAAAWWLRNEGQAWGEMIGIDVDAERLCRETKGQGR